MTNNTASIRMKDDSLIERQFVLDYSKFAIRMNLLAIFALLEKARSVSDSIERKSICLSGLQLLYSSYEDFSILLRAFRNRIKGTHIHLTIGIENQSTKGSTLMPKIFRHFLSARQMLDNFGLTSITHEKLSNYLNISADKFEEKYRDIAESIKGMSAYQDSFNDYKNKLKHGKPVVEGIENKENLEYVAFLRWIEKGGKPLLEINWVIASLEQLEVAVIQIAKIYIVSLELLWLFMLHYYPADADDYLNEIMGKYAKDTIDRVCALGLKSVGLTERT